MTEFQTLAQASSGPRYTQKWLINFLGKKFSSLKKYARLLYENDQSS